jgi:YD repeat-containing protein
VEFFYDGLNRKIAEVRHLRIGGQGKNPIDTGNPANPDGLIVMDYEYDANSRVVAKADDGSTPGDQNTTVGLIELTNPKGNATRYAYDDLNRRTQELFDDGTVKTYRYDADDNLLRTTDQNGSIVNHTYEIRPSPQSPSCRGRQEAVSTVGGLGYAPRGREREAVSTVGGLSYAPTSNEPLCPLVADASRLPPAPLPSIGPQVRVPEPGPQGQTFTVGGPSRTSEGQTFIVGGPSRTSEGQTFTVGPCSRTPGAVSVGEPSPQVFTVRP